MWWGVEKNVSQWKRKAAEWAQMCGEESQGIMNVKQWMSRAAELEVTNGKLTWKLLRALSALDKIATSGSTCSGCQAELCHPCIARKALNAERPDYDIDRHVTQCNESPSDIDGLLPGDDEE